MSIEKYLQQELKFLEAEQVAKKERVKLEKIRQSLSDEDREITTFYRYYSSSISMRMDYLTPKQQVSVHKMMIKLLQGDEGVKVSDTLYKKVSGNLILAYGRKPFHVIDIWTKKQLKMLQERAKKEGWFN